MADFVPALSLVKDHLSIDGDEQDALLEAYIQSAGQQCLDYVNRVEAPEGAEAVFKVSCLLILSFLFDNRGADAEAKMPKSAERLLDPYRMLRV